MSRDGVQRTARPTNSTGRALHPPSRSFGVASSEAARGWPLLGVSRTCTAEVSLNSMLKVRWGQTLWSKWIHPGRRRAFGDL